MSVEYATWGCANNGAGVDLINNNRSRAYLDRLGPGNNIQWHCDNADITPWVPDVYTNPEDDQAWWYCDTRPESARFFGLFTEKFDGLFENRFEREVLVQRNGSCRTNLAYGQLVDQGYEITVTQTVLGADCCAVAYGIRALTQILQGCCGGGCTGTQLRMLSCIPEDGPGCDPANPLPPETTSPWRTMSNVALIAAPSIISVGGPSCGACGCGLQTRIQWTFRANPGLFLDVETVLPPTLLNTGTCEVYCPPTDCPPDDWYVDPECSTTAPPAPPSLPAACFCPPFITYNTPLVIDVPPCPFDFELEFCVEAGSAPLRNLRVVVWREIGGQPPGSPVYTECNACAGFSVPYIPQGGELCYTSCAGTVLRSGTRVRRVPGSLLGPNGEPGSGCIKLGCGRHVIMVMADANQTAGDATIELGIREVEP